jgi:hypothetical protein
MFHRRLLPCSSILFTNLTLHSSAFSTVDESENASDGSCSPSEQAQMRRENACNVKNKEQVEVRLIKSARGS